MPEKKQISEAIADLVAIRKGPGLALSIGYGVAILILTSVIYTNTDNLPLFFATCVVYAFIYTFAMTLTHDAIHHTLTGLYYYDEIFPRLLGYSIFWPHGTYAEVHKVHHRLNGKDLADPERPSKTQAEYDRAPGWLKFYYTYQFAINVFLCGGIGMWIKTVWEGLKIFPSSAAMRKAMLTDALGIASSAGVILYLLAGSGIFLHFLFVFFVVERVMGFVHQMRSQLEHFELWQEGEHFLDTKMRNCRNIRTNPFGHLLVNGLNYHSVHHGFPAVPFYNLAEAHRRISSLYEESGDPLVECVGYRRAIGAFFRRQSFLR